MQHGGAARVLISGTNVQNSHKCEAIQSDGGIKGIVPRLRMHRKSETLVRPPSSGLNVSGQHRMGQDRRCQSHHRLGVLQADGGRRIGDNEVGMDF